MTFQTLRILNTLKKYAESTRTNDTGTWGTVCVSNIRICGVTPQQLPGHLSQLTRLGFYKKINKYFGEVRLS